MLVTDITTKRENGVSRVSANAGGAPLWFESADIELRPSPEAFGSALLLPSLNNGLPLTIDAEVCNRWLSNVEQLLDSYHEWWGYPKLLPKPLGLHKGGRKKAEKTALFFSGGVDSFFSLLKYEEPIDALITVQGFDITLQDQPRINALGASLKAIAAKTGKELIQIRTNFREHAECDKVFWERAHGGALAAVAHVLDDSFGRVLISSSYSRAYIRPWGSHFKTDPLWSSDNLEITHFGEEFGRFLKVAAIADEPLVREHLRVCWENLSESGNCSRCEKCIRVRLVLTVRGELSKYPIFEGPEFLVQQIDELPHTRAFDPLYNQLVDRGQLEPPLDRAVRRLLKRSESKERHPARLTKRTLRKVFSIATDYKRLIFPLKSS